MALLECPPKAAQLSRRHASTIYTRPAAIIAAVIVGMGIDALEPSRLAASLERRPGLAQRLFTQGEIAYSESTGDPVKHLAARFCAKEAVTKALALDAFEPGDIEVQRDGRGMSVSLQGRPAERADALGAELRVSLTHLDSIAIAVAVAVTSR